MLLLLTTQHSLVTFISTVPLYITRISLFPFCFTNLAHCYLTSCLVVIPQPHSTFAICPLLILHRTYCDKTLVTFVSVPDNRSFFVVFLALGYTMLKRRWINQKFTSLIIRDAKYTVVSKSANTRTHNR
jgi:hypothetical protein